jgi:carbon-monoxide dehydrogenase medium subunit
MKAAAFTWEAPASLQAASRAAGQGSRIIAGGQSLGPMLNLRIAQPESVVSISQISEMYAASDTESYVVLGAGITHAQIEDGLVPDIGSRILARIAANIAYRAVRNRGTIGGSLCHADPAADWVTTLIALNAEALTSSRTLPLQEFFTGAFRTCLTQREILTAIRIPKLGADSKFGYYKACRKPGEFAHAMAAILQTGTKNRIVIGAVGGVPLVFEGIEAEPATIATALRTRAPALDDVTRHMQLIAVKRAFESLAA